MEREELRQIIIKVISTDAPVYLKAQALLDFSEEYSEYRCDLIQDLFTKPTRKLKPLEDLWRKENYPCGKYVIPDTTKFYEWITLKIMTPKVCKESYLESLNNKKT